MRHLQRRDAAESGSPLARQKAQDVATRLTEGCVLGCDTVGSCRGRILGKPLDVEHAREMLQVIRGREHQVFSGVCLWDAATGRGLVRVAATRLVMDPISPSQLEDYLLSGQWEGKAVPSVTRTVTTGCT